jgi:hypothetical protein
MQSAAADRAALGNLILAQARRPWLIAGSLKPHQIAQLRTLAKMCKLC